MSLSNQNVLIMGGGSGLTLPVVRCLATQPGFAMHALIPEAIKITNLSRHFKSRTYADTSQEKELLETVKRTIQKHSIDILFPIDETLISFVQRNREVLEPLAAITPIPSLEQIENTHDKLKSAQWFSQFGLPIPTTWPIHETPLPDEASSETKHHFPIIAKPTRGSGGNGVVKLETPDALNQFLKSAPPRKESYCTQPYVEGFDIDISILCIEGNIIAYTIQQPETSSSDPFAPQRELHFVHNEAVLEIAQQFASQSKWNGPAHLDMRYDTQAQAYLLIEVNPRWWASVLGSLIAGINFPKIACDAALQQDIPPQHYQSSHFLKASVLSAIKTKWRQTLNKQAYRYTWKEMAFSHLLADPLPDLYDRFQFSMRAFKKVNLFSAKTLGVVFLLFQLIMIGHARFVQTRYFCWAPFDVQTRYHIHATIDSEPLSAEAIYKRYQIPAENWDPRSVHNIFSVIQQYEETYGADDNTEIIVRYSSNGHPERTWTWPAP